MSPKGPVGAPKQTVSIPAAESTPSALARRPDRKSTRLNSSHSQISYAVFCLKKKKIETLTLPARLARCPHRQRCIALVPASRQRAVGRGTAFSFRPHQSTTLTCSCYCLAVHC